MSKPFDYSKWDKIELSDDEEDVHPNIDKESWFRMKHRSRVEREEMEEKDKKRINEEMETANQRIRMLERDLQKIEQQKLKRQDDDDDDDDDDEDDLDDTEAIKIEIEELKTQNKARQGKLDEYEKNKKWNVDNMFQVKEERTVIKPNAAKSNYTETGYAQSTVTGEEGKKSLEQQKEQSKPDSIPTSSPPPAAAAKTTTTTSTTKSKPVAGPVAPRKPAAKHTTDPTEAYSEPDFIYTYHEFTEKYADIVETFMAIHSFEESKEFMLKNGGILLQEHACNYLLLASLEDEMNGYRDKMRHTAKQSQIVTNIAELAKSWKTHPGNVIVPFFQRLQERAFLEGFLEGVEAFVQKIISRAIVKKAEMDQQRRSGVEKNGVDLSEVPKEERLGPGGLDPLEVIETLPQTLQEAFESRDVDRLKQALMEMDPKDAEYHMKRCVDSGLWQTQA